MCLILFQTMQISVKAYEFYDTTFRKGCYLVWNVVLLYFTKIMLSVKITSIITFW